MGKNEKCSWDDRKRELNIVNHGYDFVDLQDVFDGRICVTRQDIRKTMESCGTICFSNTEVESST